MIKMHHLLVVALLFTGGCDEDDTTPLVIPDGPPSYDGGKSPFLDDCTQDTDCTSGRCVVIGGSKRCSRACSSTAPCPPYSGWSCNNQSYCECTSVGKKPDVCNIDGDCDGEPDKLPVDESCNDEDDDCNGKVDDVAPNTKGAKMYFQDVDDDGFGDDLESQWLCKAKTGWTTQGGDCDDTRKTDNPKATEICGDVYDNDCDGFQDDPDVCGLTPIVVPDVTGNYASATLKFCTTSASLKKSLDVTEILAKQDKKALKFTIRLAGAPAITSCTSYTLHLGDPQKPDATLVFVYRPGKTACGSTPTLEAFLAGQPFASTVVTAFNAADPGHVSFILEKTEIFPHLPTPTYRLKACVNAVADRVKDKTVCSDDSCEVPVHR